MRHARHRFLVVAGTILTVLHLGGQLAPRAAVAAPVRATVLMHHRLVALRGSPYARVLVELRFGGAVRASTGGYVMLDGSGAAVVDLRTTELDEHTIEPGDEVIVTVWQEPPRVLLVPPLVADVDADADRVVGRAAPGAQLELAIWRDEAELRRRTVAADAAGNVAVALGPELDLGPGDHGRLATFTSDGDVFLAPFGVLRADLRLDTGVISLHGGASTLAEVTLSAPDGEVRLAELYSLAPRYRQATLDGAPGHAGDLCGDLAAGDRVVVARPGGLLRLASHELTIPRLEVHLDAPARRVYGLGPPGSRLELVLEGPGGASEVLALTTGPEGRFTHVAGHSLDGWQAMLGYDPGVGIRALIRAATLDLDMVVYGSIVRGRAAPRSAVQVRLLDGAGRERGTAATYARSDDGAFWAGITTYLLMRDHPDELELSSVPIRPGDILEIDVSRGDPLWIPVPELTVRTDGDARIVSGTAPAGAEVEVTYDQTIPSFRDGHLAPVPIAAITVTADASGRFVADLSALRDDHGQPLDWRAGGGRVVVRESAWLVFTMPWWWLTSQVGIGKGYVAGRGAAGRTVEVTVTSPEGVVVGRGSGTVAGFHHRNGSFQSVVTGWGSRPSPGSYSLELTDELGQQAPVRIGDRVRIAVGEDRSEYVVPRLEGTLDMEEGAIYGVTLPDAALQVTIRPTYVSSETRASSITADATGAFHIPNPGVQLLDWSASAVLTEGDHSVGAFFRLPSLTVDLTASTVSGPLTDLLPATVELSRANQVVATAAVTTPAGSIPIARLVDPQGRPVGIETGDSVALRYARPAPGGVLGINVPAVTLDYDLDVQRIWGRVEPGSTVWFTQKRPYGLPRLEYAEVAPDIIQPNTPGVDVRADGTYEVRYPFGADLRPGANMTIKVRLPVGHVVSRSRVVPMVNVHLGQAEMCVLGDRDQAVELSLVEDDASVASMTGAIDWRRALEALFVGQDGASRRTVTGQRVRGRIGDVRVDTRLDELALEDVELRVESAGRWLRITARGPSGRAGYGRLRFSEDCGVDAYQGLVPYSVSPANEDPTVPGSAYGAFDVSAAGRAREGHLWRNGLELYFETAESHRYYRLVYPYPPLDLYVDSDRISGRIVRGERIELELRAVDGSVKTVMRATGDEQDRIEVRLRDAQRRPVRIAPGDVLELRVPEWMWASIDGSTELSIEPLSFDYSLADGLLIVAAPDRAVAVDLTLRDERTVSLNLRTDAHGRIVISAAPVRSTWRLEDVARVRLTVDTPAGHQLVAEGAIDEGRVPTATATSAVPTAAPTVSPRPTEHLLFAPFGATGGRGSASAPLRGGANRAAGTSD